MNDIKTSSKRANIRGIYTVCLYSPSSRTFYFLAVKPQVAFASLSSPAVMDIRPLRGRLLEIAHIINARVRSYKRLSLLSLLSLNLSASKN